MNIRIVSALAASVLLTGIALPLQAQIGKTATTTVAKRQADKVTTWAIDKDHSGIEFAVDYLVLSKVKGKFSDYAGTIVVNETDPKKSSVDFTIQVKSIDTGNAKRDEHLRGADFFDVATYPTITFKTIRVEPKGDGTYVAHGTLTMHGVGKKVELTFKPKGPVKGAFGETRYGASTKTTLNRQDYGIKWNKKADAGGAVVGDDVDVDINVSAVLQEAKKG